jgi:hypothetical protein
MPITLQPNHDFQENHQFLYSINSKCFPKLSNIMEKQFFTRMLIHNKERKKERKNINK